MKMSPTGRMDCVAFGACLSLFLAAGTTAQTTPAPATTPPATTTPSTGGATTTTNTRAPTKPTTYTKSGAVGQNAPAVAAAAPLAGPATPPATPAASPTALNQQFPEDVPVYDQPQSASGINAGSSDMPGSGPDVTVSEYNTVDMFVQDEDLANVLQMLSLQSRRNIVASKDVSARVTANLYGVTLFEALDAILHVNGYGYVEKNNFIYVYTIEELAQIQAEERKIVTKVVQLNYLNANDAAEFVAPLLSEKGQIKTNGDVGSFTIPEDSPTGDEQFALSSTLVIFDFEEHVAEIEALLSNLDTKPAQVLVEATILQTSLTEANAFGVDFALLSNVDMTDFLGLGGILGSAGVLNEGEDFIPASKRATSVVTTPGNSAGPGTFKLSLLHNDIGVFIRALDEVSDVSIVSNPKILALNRQSAKVSIGRKIGYLKSTTNNGVTEQDVEFLPTGTSLAFRPFISKDGLIRMELKPKVSEGIINEFTDNDGRTVTVPDEVSQEITTNVVVPDGSTIVLGGLFREQTRQSRSQVPILGDIPIVGAAFRGHDDNTDRSEIIFMIKPTIMNDQNLLAQGERGVSHAEAVRTGSRQGLLPWSREKQTSQLNLRAERLAADGKKDEALYALRRSLELAPLQPDAIRMQQAISGESDFKPSRSMMESIVNEEMASRAQSYPWNNSLGSDSSNTNKSTNADQDQAMGPPLLTEFFDFVLAPEPTSESAPVSPMSTDSSLFFNYEFAESAEPTSEPGPLSTEQPAQEVVTSPTPDD